MRWEGRLRSGVVKNALRPSQAAPTWMKMRRAKSNSQPTKIAAQLTPPGLMGAGPTG